MSPSRVTIVTGNVHEPEVFVQVTPKFQNGFLVLEGLWDTYMVRLNSITEIRIVPEDYGMTLNYTASEYSNEIQRIKSERDNSARDVEVAKAVAAINALAEFVELTDDQELINLMEEHGTLSGFEFRRISDVRFGFCKYKIIAKTTR